MFHKYGGSGTLQKFDALCVLGMNIINEKVLISFIWNKSLFSSYTGLFIWKIWVQVNENGKVFEYSSIIHLAQYDRILNIYNLLVF